MEQILVEPKASKTPFSSRNSNFYILDNIQTGKVTKKSFNSSSKNKINQQINKKEKEQRKRIRKIRERYEKYHTLETIKEKKHKIRLSDAQKIDNLYHRIKECGIKETEFVNSVSTEFFSVPIYCNNRACSNRGCMEHRGYLFNRNHTDQIKKLDQNIRKPKGWVFTGWKIPLQEISREFLQEKLLHLNKLCNTFSVSAYSIHLEIKIYKENMMGYIHFHVVSGGFRQIRIVIKKWGRVVKNQDAIKKKSLNYYVSKYASKTPNFNSDLKREKYHLLVYKLQMHRFSIKKDSSLSKRESEFVNMELLLSEVKRELYRTSYLNPLSRARGGPKENQYYSILEKPPPKQNIIEVGC